MTIQTGAGVSQSVQPAAPGTRARIKGLDGARGLSCLGVAIMHICGHYSPHTADRPGLASDSRGSPLPAATAA